MMDSNQKKFGLYVFLSTFSRNLIEVFIPVILYKFGYSLKEVIYYYLLTNVFSLVLTYPITDGINNKTATITISLLFLVIKLDIFFISSLPETNFTH